jgi:hypothetical protein
MKNDRTSARNEKHESRDRKRDRDGVQAKRKAARKAKQNRRAFESGTGKHR